MNAQARIICLVFPIGASEATLLSSRGSIEIIAAEQYLLMRAQITECELLLYDEAIVPRATDVLIIMTCLTLVPAALIQRFERVVYFFDDLTTDKWQYETAYSERVSKLSAIFHPLNLEADRLSRHVLKQTFYVPWSLSRMPVDKLRKSAEPSFFVDMDDRAPYIDSLPAANSFIRVIGDLNFKIHVPAKCLPHIPTELQKYVEPVPLMPHGDFLEFMSSIWFYASGIKGSYEFVVLESAFLGCGLISLFSAVKAEHQARHFYLPFDESPGFVSRLQEQLSIYNPSDVLTQAHSLYPADATKQIPHLIQRIFSTAS